MKPSVVQRRLRPGLDVNGSSWVMARYRADWRAARTDSLSYEAGALVLAPRARPELAADWLPLAPVTAPDGTRYVADPERDLLLAQRACDAEPKPLPGVGGSGFATGRFATPLGVAVDGRGRVYVADAGNARVQVIVPAHGDGAESSVLAVLTDGLQRPIHVAVAPSGEIFVADVLTSAIHVFSSAFAPLRTLPLATLDAWSGEPWAAPPDVRPLAVAVRADGTIAAFDPLRPALWHMTARGAALPSLPWPGADDDIPAGWIATERRFAAAGEAIVGPIDGGVHNLAWHRVAIDAELPPGTWLTAQTYADNDAAPASIAWAPRVPIPVPRAAVHRAGEEVERLVLPDRGAWPRWRAGRLTRARPELLRFAGSGPVSVDRVELPFAVAARVRVGDRVALVTDAGGRTEVDVAAAEIVPVAVAASRREPGPGLAGAPASVRLLARDGTAPPYGPLDLSFVADAAAFTVGALNLDGRSENLLLPCSVAAFLRVGDVVAVLSPATEVRLEILEVPELPLEVRFDRPVEGDFSTSTLVLLDTPGRLIVREPLPEAADVPPGTQLAVGGDVHNEQKPVAWLDAAQATIWLGPAVASGTVTAASWTHAEFGAPRSTDRGRYLWVRLRLAGAPLPPPDGVGPPVLATATPAIRSLRVTAPRPSLLDWLPEIFARRDPTEDPPGANFMERFLALFEGELTRIETAYESVSRLLNPLAADDEWLTFVASWLELAFDPSWPIERRRVLVLEGAALQAARGTPAALARYLEIYTGVRPAIVEGFRLRPPAPLTLGASGALGVAPLGSAALPERFAHRFTVAVPLPVDRDRAAARSAVLKIIEAMKPAHTRFTLDTGAAVPNRIGIDTAIGGIVIPVTDRDPCACDPDENEARRVPQGHVAAGFRLGGTLGRGAAPEMSFGGE